MVGTRNLDTLMFLKVDLNMGPHCLPKILKSWYYYIHFLSFCNSEASPADPPDSTEMRHSRQNRTSVPHRGVGRIKIVVTQTPSNLTMIPLTWVCVCSALHRGDGLQTP